MDILILAEHRASVASLAAALVTQGFVVNVVTSVADALEAMVPSAPDHPCRALHAALLEVESGGLVLCRELLYRDSSIPVLLFSSTRTDPLDRVVGFMLGADDYLVTPLHPEEVRWRIQRSVSRAGEGSTRRGPPSSAADATFRALTPREQDILARLLAGRTQRQIARELVISDKTVGTHIQHILAKLDVHHRAEAIALAHRLGFRPGVTNDGHAPQDGLGTDTTTVN